MAAEKAIASEGPGRASEAAESAVQAAREAKDVGEAEGVAAPGARAPQRGQCSKQE